MRHLRHRDPWAERIIGLAMVGAVIVVGVDHHSAPAPAAPPDDRVCVVLEAMMGLIFEAPPPRPDATEEETRAAEQMGRILDERRGYLAGRMSEMGC